MGAHADPTKTRPRPDLNISPICRHKDNFGGSSRSQLPPWTDLKIGEDLAIRRPERGGAVAETGTQSAVSCCGSRTVRSIFKDSDFVADALCLDYLYLNADQDLDDN